MRVTSSAKSFFLLLFGVTALAALALYICMYHPQLATILGGCLMVIVIIFIFWVNIPPLFNFLGERANSVLEIYPDASGNGLHIFSEFTTSRIKLGLSPLRSIQYYFLNTGTRKMYYKVLLTHSMESASGRSGYVDFSSFEENILEGPELKDAMEEYSVKEGWPLKLGHAVQAGEDESYETPLGEYIFRIQTKPAMIQDTLRVCCCDQGGKTLWSKKI